MSTEKLTIDIVSDVVCPWCIIGYKRLEKALSMFDGLNVDLHWHPFELNPHMPMEGENLRSHLAAKYGTTLEGSIKARANLTKIGQDLGFQFDYFDEMKMYNTFNAHQLIRFAKTKGKTQAMALRLFAAFFGERKNIADNIVLIKEAGAIGLDKHEVSEVLNKQLFASDVRSEQAKWRGRGISSVPTYIFNNDKMVSGAHEPEALAAFISGHILAKA